MRHGLCTENTSYLCVCFSRPVSPALWRCALGPGRLIETRVEPFHEPCIWLISNPDRLSFRVFNILTDPVSCSCYAHRMKTGASIPFVSRTIPQLLHIRGIITTSASRKPSPIPLDSDSFICSSNQVNVRRQKHYLDRQ